MADFKGRLKRLEQSKTFSNAALLATLLRRANGEGSLSGAVAAIERERGPLKMDPVFRQRAERIESGVRAMTAALFAVEAP